MTTQLPTINVILRRVPQLRYMSLPTSHWYVVKSTWWWSSALSRTRVEPTLTKRTIAWYNVIPSDSKRSRIYPFWSILRISFSQVISHLMIFLASPRFFILNSLKSSFFSHSKAFRLLKPSTRSSTYTPTIINSLFHYMVRICALALVGVKPIFLKNLVIILFQNRPTCFRPYRFFKILQTRLFRPTRHLCGIFIKIGYLFWPSALFKNAPTLSICMNIISNIVTMAKNILNDLCLTVGAKVSM